MYRILIAEDETNMRSLLVKAIQREGYEAVPAENGSVALERHREQPVDLMVLDLMMPVMSGFDVLKALRPRDPVPVLMLTAQGQEPTRLEGFTLGADDYLLKPFSGLELLARIRAILRRTERVREIRSLGSGPFRLDCGTRVLLRDGERVPLSAMETHVLEALLNHPGRSLSRQEILQMAWPSGERPSPRTVDVHMVNLRHKLTRDGDPPWIVSERVRGFRWTADVQSLRD
jgi:DNA-binding response OmpR family regulator